MLQNNECRGCKRFALSAAGMFYQFVSEPGWEPTRLIIDTDGLLRLLQEKPRPVGLLTPNNTPALVDIVSDHEIFPEHIMHVDNSLPTLLGEFTFTETTTGRKEIFHLCPDGHHRVAKCLQTNEPVKVVLFTEEEMKANSYTSAREFMEHKGVFVIGPSDEEVEKVMWGL